MDLGCAIKVVRVMHVNDGQKPLADAIVVIGLTRNFTLLLGATAELVFRLCHIILVWRSLSKKE